MSFSAAILIAAIIIIRAIVLHRLPKITFLVLWGIVLLRLLLPFNIPSQFSIHTGVEYAMKQMPQNTPFFTEQGRTSDMLDISVDSPIGVEDAGTLHDPLFVIWLVGIFVCAVFFTVGYFRCWREFRTALPVENGFANRWRNAHPLKRFVQIRQSDRIKTPLTYGIFHPVLLLPKVTDWDDEVKLKYILVHEYIHIKRFDVLTKILLVTAVCVHWFNPLAWVMYVFANRDIELACDEAVVKEFGEPTKSAYAMALISLEERKSLLTPLCNNFSKNAIEERINAIMKIKKFSMPIIVVAMLLVTGVAVCFLTSNASAGTNENLSSRDITEVSTDTLPLPSTYVTVDESQPASEADEPLAPLNSKKNVSKWVWPVEGCDTIASMFGKRVHPISGEVKFSDHIQISGNGVEGATVYAALAGKVSDAGFDAEQGNFIVISHENSIKTIYGHLDTQQVSEGDAVTAGEKIGTVGATGNATGPFLAFGVVVDGTAVNPMAYLSERGK